MTKLNANEIVFGLNYNKNNKILTKQKYVLLQYVKIIDLLE